ncbi:MAG: hypothetical protein J7J91_09365 [Deltaproteobacteria bacterium]|nr:hypothetical protein [Deltaproteobacteria bacterium]
MPGRARLDAPGTVHHVIVRGIEEGRIVDDRRDRGNFSVFLQIPAQSAHEYRFRRRASEPG